MNVRLSATARRDLQRATEYLDRETGNPEVADRLLNDLDHLLDLLAKNPLMGREWAELRRGMRGFPHSGYMVFWEIRKDTVQVLRIMHQKQDIEAAFKARGKTEL